jgi:hypothetical protein
VSLKSQIAAVQKGLPITVMHEEWMTANPEPHYSKAAQEFAATQLAGKSGSQRLRKRMFRASSAGQCTRRQVLAMAGVPKMEKITPDLAAIFATGHFIHLKWQMQGLTAGWLKVAEVPVDRDDLRAGGTMDGICHDDGGFELKSINSRGFGSVNTYGPKDMHDFQVHHYMYLGGLDHFSIVYENKDTQEWREFLVPRNEKTIRDVRESIERLNEYLDNKKLPPVLPECAAMSPVGPFRNCPFKDSCLKIKIFPRGKE